MFFLEVIRKECQFCVIDCGKGKVILQAMNGAGFVSIVGEKLSGDVRLKKDRKNATELIKICYIMSAC